jgi:hypothetical protein
MSVWDVPRTDQLPAGCSPALFFLTCTAAVAGSAVCNVRGARSRRSAPPQRNSWHAALLDARASRPLTAQRSESQQVRFRLTC